MIQIIKQSIRFIVFLLVQLCVLNNLEIGLGIQLMIYPLFIFMLPLELNVFVIMLISFLFGYIIDLFSNTYGLHASAAVLLAYFLMEQFNFNDFWFLIMKVFLSVLSSISLCIIIQYTFLNKSDSR